MARPKVLWASEWYWTRAQKPSCLYFDTRKEAMAHSGDMFQQGYTVLGVRKVVIP